MMKNLCFWKRTYEDRTLIKIGLALAILSVIVLIIYVKDYPSPEVGAWADFATYFGASISLLSAVLLYLTYRSQTSMSSVLQFESTFFQWYKIHTDLLADLKPMMADCIDKLVVPTLKNGSFYNLAVFEQLAQKDIPRPLHRYYRSMFHLFKYIKLSPVLKTYEQRKKYYDIVQSNMSDDELLLFLCFVLGDENREKPVFGVEPNQISFKELVDEGHILKNCYVPDPELLRRMTPKVRECFPKTAVKSFHFFTEEAMKG